MDDEPRLAQFGAAMRPPKPPALLALLSVLLLASLMPSRVRARADEPSTPPGNAATVAPGADDQGSGHPAIPEATTHRKATEHESHVSPHPVWTLPFIALLLLIATLPLHHKTHHWWENNVTKLVVALMLGQTVLLYYGIREVGFHGALPGKATVLAVLDHAIMEEYVPFIVLLFSLYVVAGGLQLRGDLLAYPSVNTALLGVGALIASFIGTTGASMVLIRPLLQTNRDRKYVVHTVVFFIFLVSNIGGTLLPIGDPPLFLGYIEGVPFFWTLGLVGPWAFCVTTLLIIYYIWDHFYAYPKEKSSQDRIEIEHLAPLRLGGWINLFYLGGIVAAAALIVPDKKLIGTSWVVPELAREGVMLVIAGLSLLTTPKGLRTEVQFNYTAILEVAALFLGIFLTMQVPIEILQAQGTSLPMRQPWHFFWATGLLSSFLDNAPTYLVFFKTAGTLGAPSGEFLTLVDGAKIGAGLVTAISLGAVFMGANTYIGNGPNFMVKSIAEGQGVKMPSFFGYMKYSMAVLVPLFVVVTLIFFR